MKAWYAVEPVRLTNGSKERALATALVTPIEPPEETAR